MHPELHHHPAAEIFPMMEGAGFDELVKDIREYGVNEAIVLHDGMILDGRNRYLAAKIAGAECPTKPFDGNDPVAFVVSHNLHRRHLNEAQRAVAAAKIATLRHGQRADYMNENKADVANGTSALSIPQAAESSALQWLIRYKRGVLEDYKAPCNKLIRRARIPCLCNYDRGRGNGGYCRKPIMPGDLYVEGEGDPYNIGRNGVMLPARYCPECAGVEALAAITAAERNTP